MSNFYSAALNFLLKIRKLMLNNNSRELVPITNCSGCKSANELRSPDEDAPIALNLNRWFCYPQPLSQSGQDQRPHVQWRPYTIKPCSLRSRRRSLRSRQPRSCSIRVTLIEVIRSHWMSSCDPLWQTSLIAAVSFSSKSQSLAEWGSQTGAAYSNVERTNVMYAVSLSLYVDI